MSNTLEIENPKAVLSTLWIFLFLNMLLRDVHELVTADFLKEALTGTINGTVVTDGAILAGGVALEILLVMTVLARILPYKVNRMAHIVLGAIAVPLIVFGTAPGDADDIFFVVIEVLAALAIVFIAVRWKNTLPAPEGLNPRSQPDGLAR